MTPRAAATVVVAALLAAACGTDTGDLDPAVQPPSAPGSGSATLSTVECPSGFGTGVVCGVASVLVDRAVPDGATTTVSFAVVAGTDDDSVAPLAVLQGGPGGASTDLVRWFPRRGFAQVFVDQRGTGFGSSDLDCREVDDALPAVLAVSSEDARRIQQAAVDSCAVRLGGDPLLAATDSVAHAGDVVDVLQALGIERWLAYGVSYGSTIVLEILRAGPNGLVGAVLDGVYPPDLDVDAALGESATAALSELGGACAASAECGRLTDHRSVTELVVAAMDELDRDPAVVTVGAARTGLADPVDVVLDGDRLAELTFLLLYDEQQARFVPAAIAGVVDGDVKAVRWLAEAGTAALVGAHRANAEGTYFAVQCHDRLPFTSDTRSDTRPGDRFASAVAAVPLASGCRPWERAPAPASADDAVNTALPVLLLSGRFDPITPPSFATRLAATLADATLVTRDGRGHGIWYGDDCVGRIVDAFVADPAAPLDTSCAAAAVAVEWARP